MPWNTPDSLPSETVTKPLKIPDSVELRGAVRGALYELTLESNWEELGTVTPAEVSSLFWTMFEDFIMSFDVVGAIVMWPTNSAPNRWLICDGQAVDRATYAALFNLIGTTYGAGNGTTTFNLPDLRAKFPVGRHSSNTRFDTIGETGGQESVSHTHTLDNGTTRNNLLATPASAGAGWDNAASTGVLKSYSGAGAASFRDIVKTMNSQAVETLPPYITLNFIICATGS